MSIQPRGSAGRVGLACACATLAVAALAPAARADVPPSLMGESFFGSGSVTGTCDKQGMSTIHFSASGTAAGPYSGRFTEQGTAQLGPQTEPGPFTNAPEVTAGPVTQLQVSFQIDSPTGQVSGTKTLLLANPGEGVCQTVTGIPTFHGLTDVTISAVSLGAQAVYDAVIKPPTGSSFRDTGRASVMPGSTEVSGTDPATGGQTGSGGSGLGEIFAQSEGVVPLCTNEPLDPTALPAPGNGFGDPNHCHTGPPGQGG